jgi:hypothetical protein
MNDDHAFNFLRQQLTLLARRVERLEGKVEQLRVESIPPGLVYPTRRDFQQLEERMRKLEGGK